MANDITVEGSGTVYLLVPESDAGREWLAEHLDIDNSFQPYWPAKAVVEHRYVRDIVAAALADGLGVR